MRLIQTMLMVCDDLVIAMSPSSAIDLEAYRPGNQLRNLRWGYDWVRGIEARERTLEFAEEFSPEILWRVSFWGDRWTFENRPHDGGENVLLGVFGWIVVCHGRSSWVISGVRDGRGRCLNSSAAAGYHKSILALWLSPPFENYKFRPLIVDILNAHG